MMVPLTEPVRRFPESRDRLLLPAVGVGERSCHTGSRRRTISAFS
jgi:hypothetical protein